MIEDNKYTRMTKRHEAIGGKPNKKAYRINGHWTIGVGHDLTAHGEPVPARGWSDDKSNSEYSKDYIEAEDTAAKITGPRYDSLTRDQQGALNDMTFQMGSFKFPKMLDALKSGDVVTAGKEMLNSDWAKTYKSRASDLANLWTGVSDQGSQ